MLSKKWQEIIVLFVFLSTSAIGFLTFGNFSLDLEEIFALTYAKDINSLNYIEYLNGDLGNPPLFFFLLKPWAMISESEAWLRLLPFVFYSASILVLKKILPKLSNSTQIKTMVIVAFLGVGAYLYIRFNLRAYSLLLLTSLLTIYFTFKILSENSNRKDSLILILIMTIGINSHYIYWLFSGFWFSSLLAISLKNKINFRIIKQFIFSIIVSLIINVPLFANIIKRELLEKSEYSYYWWQLERSKIKWSEIWEIIFKFSTNTKNEILNESIGYLSWFGLFILLSATIKKTKNLKVKLLLFFLNLFWITYLITPISSYLSIQKYIALFIALLTASIPIIIEQWEKIKIKNNLFYVFCLSTLAVWSLSPLPFKHKVNFGDDWKSVIKLIEQNNESHALVVDCFDLIAFKHYAKKETLEKIYGDKHLPAKNDCDLELINSSGFKYEKIFLVKSQQPVQINVGDNYEITKIETKQYWPISITTYEKNHE